MSDEGTGAGGADILLGLAFCACPLGFTQVIGAYFCLRGCIERDCFNFFGNGVERTPESSDPTVNPEGGVQGPIVPMMGMQTKAQPPDQPQGIIVDHKQQVADRPMV